MGGSKRGEREKWYRRNLLKSNVTNSNVQRGRYYPASLPLGTPQVVAIFPRNILELFRCSDCEGPVSLDQVNCRLTRAERSMKNNLTRYIVHLAATIQDEDSSGDFSNLLILCYMHGWSEYLERIQGDTASLIFWRHLFTSTATQEENIILHFLNLREQNKILRKPYICSISSTNYCFPPAI